MNRLHQRIHHGREANVIKWLWSIIWGKKKSSRSRSRSGFSSLLRWFTPGLTVTSVFGAVIAILTGQVNLPTLDTLRGTEPPVYEDPIAESVANTGSPLRPTGYASARVPANTSNRPSIAPVSLTTTGTNSPGTGFTDSGSSAKSPTTIRVATFNIQMFGDKKSSNAEVMDKLAQIFMQFDVIAVQEIRGNPDLPIDRLMNAIGQRGGRYQGIHGPPLGRSSQTECYGYVWDQTRIALVPDSNYVIDDSADRMHRQPMIASFQTIFAPTESRTPFRFTMMNVHTDPDEVRGDTPENELNVLDDVFQSVRNFEYEVAGEDDYILLGDLNVDVGGLKELGQIPGIVSLIGDVPTNTRKSKTYDHIMIDARVTTEYVRRSGVMDLESFFQIDTAAAVEISDHLPVWAEFSVHESPRTF
ncbi:endonuclease/exonuclease/phosphatase family protein [Neorhodopirellula lusitana]|uniref:endonuclease/exonuclease/phosphatase family protein n=1 Tax=Neorhodopirellula lusitana TaxID=445327 RepID=UPI0024B6A548|nr:endonuclease/exonuclease/phosphatase family protein [Neorhodopirellula lusitana]